MTEAERKIDTGKPMGYGWYTRMCQIIATSSFYCWFKFRYKLKIYGRENIPVGQGSHIVTSNHLSNWDPPLVSVAMRYHHVAYMAKLELFDTPFKAWLQRSLGAFPVNREKVGPSTIKAAKEVLQTGDWHLGLFPEGTRNKDGSMGRPKRGFAFIAKATKAPILPIGIYWTGPNKDQLVARIGKSIPPREDTDALMDEVWEAIRLLAQDPAETDSEK